MPTRISSKEGSASSHHSWTPRLTIARVSRRSGDVLGMQVIRMTPEDHDRALALTSHLPHVAAAALASLLTGDLRHLAATGFRDTTRIAGGDPRLWSAIFLNNAEPLTADIDQLISRLSELRSAIEENDEDRLQGLLEQGSHSAGPHSTDSPSCDAS